MKYNLEDSIKDSKIRKLLVIFCIYTFLLVGNILGFIGFLLIENYNNPYLFILICSIIGLLIGVIVSIRLKPILNYKSKIECFFTVFKISIGSIGFIIMICYIINNTTSTLTKCDNYTLINKIHNRNNIIEPFLLVLNIEGNNTYVNCNSKYFYFVETGNQIRLSLYKSIFGFDYIKLKDQKPFLINDLFKINRKKISSIKKIKGYEKCINITPYVNLNYGKEIEDTLAKQLAQIIIESQFMNDFYKTDILFDCNNDNYILKFTLTDTTFLNSPSFVSCFENYEEYINNHWKHDKKVKICFTDINFKEEYKLPKMNFSTELIDKHLTNLNQYRINDFHTVYYNDSISILDLKKIVDSINKLKSYFPEYLKIKIVFLNNGNDYSIKYFVEKELWNDPIIIEKAKGIIEYLKYYGIEKNIKLIFVDNITFEEQLIYVI